MASRVPAGPFDRWPNGWGFDYFYGILGGGSSQYDPCLAENQKIIGTPAEFYDEENPYYFPTRSPTEPSSGCTGYGAGRPQALLRVLLDGLQPCPAPRRQGVGGQVQGPVRPGMDRLPEETFARQKELGVIPADAELTPRAEAFPAWDDVPDNLKAVDARQMEVYAGYSENADHNVGRVIDAIDDLGELDNTLVIWIWGDNGASMEGTVTGSFNELTMQNGIPLTDEMQLQLTELHGGLDAWSSRSWRRTTGQPGRGRGTRRSSGASRSAQPRRDANPMVVHWPAQVGDPAPSATRSPM